MDKQYKQCIRDVLRYYKKNGRQTLPWRKNIVPYKVLVSEIMLQQTQVNRVVQKFLLWMKQYPNLRELGKSNLTDVLTIWQGLGYQRRAKSLLLIAKGVRTLPKNFESLISLPGIGTYTASAICAFAYNKFSHPLLETNIRTVLIEYFHKEETYVHDKTLYNDLMLLEQFDTIKKIGAREWYYALMDFGAFLKANKISHNKKSKHYSKQGAYAGSFRQLRATVLFSLTHQKPLPVDERLPQVLSELVKEGYIVNDGKKYSIMM